MLWAFVIFRAFSWAGLLLAVQGDPTRLVILEILFDSTRGVGGDP